MVKMNKRRMEIRDDCLIMIRDTLCNHCFHKDFPICKMGVDLKKKGQWHSCLLFKNELSKK